MINVNKPPIALEDLTGTDWLLANQGGKPGKLPLEVLKSFVTPTDGNTGGGDNPGTGGGYAEFNVIDYNPDDNVVITPLFNPVAINSATGWDGQYLTALTKPPTANVGGNSLVSRVGVKFPVPRSGSFTLDLKDFTDTASMNSVSFYFLPNDKTPDDLMTQVIAGNLTPHSFAMCDFSKLSQGGLHFGTTSYTPLLGGADGGSGNIPDKTKIALHFFNYIEYAVLVEGLTLEEIYAQIPAEVLAIYSKLALMMFLPEGGEFPQDLRTIMGFDDAIGTLWIQVQSFENPDGSSSNFDLNNKIEIGASARSYVLPENAKDGNFLNIKKNVTLLGMSLQKDDTLVLYGNKTKGIVIRLPSAPTVEASGEFLGYLTDYPTAADDLKEGNWFIKLTPVAGNDYKVMYVYAQGSWITVGYVPSNAGTGGLIWDQNTNRVRNTNNVPVAGFLGANWSSPYQATYGESSLYYDYNYQRLRYSSGGSWSNVPAWFLGAFYSEPSITDNGGSAIPQVYLDLNVMAFKYAEYGRWNTVNPVPSTLLANDLDASITGGTGQTKVATPYGVSQFVKNTPVTYEQIKVAVDNTDLADQSLHYSATVFKNAWILKDLATTNPIHTSDEPRPVGELYQGDHLSFPIPQGIAFNQWALFVRKNTSNSDFTFAFKVHNNLVLKIKCGSTWRIQAWLNGTQVWEWDSYGTFGYGIPNREIVTLIFKESKFYIGVQGRVIYAGEVAGYSGVELAELDVESGFGQVIRYVAKVPLAYAMN